MAPLLLVTIGFSHFCEKARWALDRAKIAYREEAHPPILHMVGTLPRGGRSVPLLVTPHGSLGDSTDILRFVDRLADPALRLYPEDPGLRREVEQLEDRFDEVLGPATRRWAYDYLLADAAIAREAGTRGVSRIEAALLRGTFPLATRVLRRGMRIDAAGVERSRGRMREIFGEVDALLADGQRFLVGDRFTAADLTFAALAAPAAWPQAYADRVVGLEHLAAPMQDEIASLRATPSGRFVLDLYARERGGST